MATSIDRFLAIKFKLNYKTVVTDKRVAFVTRLGWFISLVIPTLLSGLSLHEGPAKFSESSYAIWAAVMQVVITVLSSMSFHKLKKITSQTNTVNQQIPSGSSQFDAGSFKCRQIYYIIILCARFLFRGLAGDVENFFNIGVFGKSLWMVGCC